MRWFLLLLVLAMGDYTPTNDGAPNDENIPATYAANRVVGDIYPQGADLPFQRLVDTVTGAGLFTTNSDPNVVGVDPLTGEDAPAGTDVGFGAAVRRYIQTGVLNGDFALPPPDTSAPISDDNPLPYWKFVDGSDSTSWWVSTTATGSRGSFVVIPDNAPSVSVDEPYLEQLVPVPSSAGQQYRGLASVYIAFVGTSSKPFLKYQYIEGDGSTTIGSEISSTLIADGPAELKVDMGLVPTNAAFVRLRVGVGANFSSTYPFYEVRAAFLPVEATVGLKTTTARVGPFDTVQTQLVGATIPANTFVVGSVYEFDVWGNVTSTAANTVTFRIRVGTTTLTGTIVENIAPTATTTASDNSFHLTGMVTVRSVGASGTIIGGLQFIGQDTQPFTVRLRASQAPAAVTVDTTVANILEVTAVASAGTTDITVEQATIKCVMAS